MDRCLHSATQQIGLAGAFIYSTADGEGESSVVGGIPLFVQFMSSETSLKTKQKGQLQ